MSEPLTNLLENNVSDNTEIYYHATSEENFESMMAEGGIRPNNREDCNINPGPQILKEDVIRILKEGPNPRDNSESIINSLFQPSHYDLDVITYIESNLEKFNEYASEESKKFLEKYEDSNEMREEFDNPILEFRGPASGVHWHEVNSLAPNPESVEIYGDITLEIHLPENSTYAINGYRVPGVIPMDFVETVYGNKETINELEDKFEDKYEIKYSTEM